MFCAVKAKLAVLTEQQGGVFSRQDALACGYTSSEIRTQLKTGSWRRLCRGQYTAQVIDPSMPPWIIGAEVHRLASFAALRSMTGDVVLSHQSATVHYGLSTWGLDLSRVHVTRRDAASGRITRLVVQHNAQLPVGSVWLRDGHHVVAPARAVIEIACTAGLEPALAVADEALHKGLVSRRALEFALCDAESWPHASGAKQVVALCNGLSESVGESRLRLLLYNFGLPEPILQARIRRDGRLIARVDFLFPEYNTVVEFDGMMKYGADSAVLIQEKRREDEIRELGYQVVRVTWPDLDLPQRTVNRIQQAFVRSQSQGDPRQTRITPGWNAG
jgi:hypothetical protein